MCGTVDSLVDVWHDVSAPIVDNPIGRTLTNVFTGGLSAPAFAAYDMSNGRDIGSSLFGGVAGYYGGAAANSAGSSFLDNFMSQAPESYAGLDTGAVDLTGSGLENLVKGGNTVAGTGMPTAGGFMTPDYIPQDSMVQNMSFGTSPLGSGISGADTGVNPTGMVTAGDFNPTATVGQGAPLAYTPQPSMGNSFSTPDLMSMFTDSNNWLKSNTGMGLGGWGTGLYDMFKKQQAADQLRSMASADTSQWNKIEGSIDSMYAPGSAEYEALKQQIERKDAAAGRNSQYGQRAVDLAARIADIKARQRAAMANSQMALSGRSQTYKAAASALNNGAYNSLLSNWTLSNLR